jgi:preprotein translocase subunit YajC
MTMMFATALVAMGAPPGTQPNPAAESLKMLGLMAFAFVFIYMISIRPQQKKARQHAELLKGLRAGDKVLTSGGILGVVIAVKDKSVSIRSADTKLEILKSAVSEITERGAASSSGNDS